ncbi:MAG: aminopeptidase N [Desulfobacteraceae bacterium]|nr:aminopeptidase N [Desulfobacteraceae bacterium]
MKTPRTIYLKDYTPPAFIVDTIDLTFDIREDETMATSRLHVRRNTDREDQNTALVFDKGDYEILSVIADGLVLLPGEYRADDETFTLAKTPDTFELEITTRLKPAENTSLEGLYVSGGVLVTQCESQGFRKITPFPDRPDVMAVYSCTIIADRTRCPVLLSNGNLVKHGDLEGNRHFVRWEDPFKKPCYLFALVAGDLAHIRDEFKTRSGRTVELKIYSEKDNIDKCGHAMTSLKQAMLWDERRFGLEYDLDLYQIVAINDFNAGAMENKGLNIFNSKFVLADAKTATDDDFMNVQAVIGHEYFHNWTGNRVTLKNWFQLSLKEGLTVFRDQEFSSDLNSRGVERITNVRNLRGSQFPEDAGPMAHPVMPGSYIKMDNFYTMTVYEKGSELIRMIHQILGEETFQNGMGLYFERFDGKAVTIEDFIGVMEEAGKRDLKQFRGWYFQSGTPVVNITRRFHGESGRLEITFTQKTLPDRNQSEKRPLHIPVAFGLMDKTGKDITPDGKALLELKAETETFVFDGIPEKALPSCFRQFSAPVKIDTDFTDEELAFLMAHDTDEINRWDSAQTLFYKEIKRIIKAIQAGEDLSVSENLILAFEKTLADESLDRFFISKMLSLPSEIEIKEHFDPVDVDAVHGARLFLEREIAKQLRHHFLEAMDLCSKADPFSISHGAMADRSLKNLSLSYLGSLKEQETTRLVRDHFASAKNMTDEIAAFKILADIDPDTKANAVEQFYAKWQHDKLVLDKWFMVQAGSSLPDTLDRVKALVDHPDFSMKNPNKVRALVHLFAMQNHIRFHGMDGAGYRFISDQIIGLDQINHQIAARLASCFNHWKKYDGVRKNLMKKELERIMNIKSLSKNVYEIVSRASENP